MCYFHMLWSAVADKFLGAHVYHLSQILHNYPDHVCHDILKRVAEAMSPKSRLLIVEAVLPAQTEVGGDMGGYLIDVSGLFSSFPYVDRSNIPICMVKFGS